jgi:hypothetical protein
VQAVEAQEQTIVREVLDHLFALFFAGEPSDSPDAILADQSSTLAERIAGLAKFRAGDFGAHVAASFVGFI